MSALITFPTLTNESVLWPTLAAANTFFTDTVVPSATTSAEGSVKKMAAVADLSSTWSPTTTSINIQLADGSFTTLSLLTSTDITNLTTKITELNTKVNDLLAAARTAGLLTT